ncbi:hypothetical protein [Bradyrhizobium sp.]|uniref:hypothetical protein n=1 Tax=Bradyrhizobium sp. TaxID=376 RepID=UPI002DDD3664|nr:hypothetical protein [Bradyrhizobium sp.]HEV2155412.1 hypothetical protein [Bradyrhizobium sp.]
MESSTIENPGEVTDIETPAGGEDGGAASAASSTAQTDDSDAGLLSVVRDVVSERPAAAASSAEGAEAGQGAGGAQSTEPDNETFSDVPFHKHPRFQALVGQRNAFREDAGRYKNITDYLEQNNLSSEEAANALSTFARAKFDPAGAFAELKPWLQNLLVAAGEVLPDDLKSRVEKGELTHEVALEMSRMRAKDKSHETRQGFEAQRQQRQSQVSLSTELATAAMDWESDRKVKDPNFEAKYPMLEREVAYLQQKEGKPKTKDGVVAQLKKAYEAVNKAFKPAAPTPQPGGRKPPVAPVTSGQAKNGAAQPKKPLSTLDIVRANRAKKAS